MTFPNRWTAGIMTALALCASSALAGDTRYADLYPSEQQQIDTLILRSLSVRAAQAANGYCSDQEARDQAQRVIDAVILQLDALRERFVERYWNDETKRVEPAYGINEKVLDGLQAEDFEIDDIVANRIAGADCAE
ncbi:hypothetical protein [Parvularcula marina]|uniref:hypothetical protein n=1 Tax=Parvularcula marina TaxID=2292771 RepID=UPI00351999B2